MKPRILACRASNLLREMVDASPNKLTGIAEDFHPNEPLGTARGYNLPDSSLAIVRKRNDPIGSSLCSPVQQNQSPAQCNQGRAGNIGLFVGRT